MFKKTTQKLVLVNADPPSKAFWSVDGHIFHNLLEMKQALEEMSNETYRYHVNKDKNDFAEWVRLIALDEILASALESADTRSAALRLVTARLKDYQH